MTTISARSVAAAAALQPLGLSLMVSASGFIITSDVGNPSEAALSCKSIEEVDAWIAGNRPSGAVRQNAAPRIPELLRYAPDAVTVLGDGGFRVGNDVLTPAELRDRGFARANNISFDSEWVQANGFQVRGLFRRGDAQRFTGAELRDMVMAFFAEHGVEVEEPEQLEAFCFNYEGGIDLDKARAQAAADMSAVAAPLKLIEERPPPRVGDDVHYVSHGSPVLADGTQAYKSVCRAAKVTAVYGAKVDLFVMNPNGTFHDQGTRYDGGTFAGPEREASPGEPLPLVTCADLTFEGGTWHWPGSA